MLVKLLMDRPVWQWRPMGFEDGLEHKPIHTVSAIDRYMRLFHSQYFIWAPKKKQLILLCQVAHTVSKCIGFEPFLYLPPSVQSQTSSES